MGADQPRNRAPRYSVSLFARREAIFRGSALLSPTPARFRASISLVPRRLRTSPRRSPSQRRAHDTVGVLLDATELVLARRGFASTTTNHIADEAGVSIGTLYHYFPSKEGLVEAVVHRMWTRELAVLAARHQELAEGPLDQAVRAIVTDLVAVVVARQALYRRWYAEASHLGSLAEGLEITAQAAAAVHDALARRAGEMRPRNLAFAADLVVKMALAMVRTGARDWDREMRSGELAEELSDMIVRYLMRG
jgi:AcrR family transcriptional regulator